MKRDGVSFESRGWEQRSLEADESIVVGELQSLALPVILAAP